MTMTGVCSRSARSKASAPIEKHSVGFDGNSSTCLVSPWLAKAHEMMSGWPVRVGMPVEGPPRWMLNSTTGTSAK